MAERLLYHRPRLQWRSRSTRRIS